MYIQTTDLLTITDTVSILENLKCETISDKKDLKAGLDGIASYIPITGSRNQKSFSNYAWNKY